MVTVTAGISSDMWSWLRPVGSASRISRSSTSCCTTLRMSTSGDSPVTVIDSSTPPTRSSAFTVAIMAPESEMPSRTTVEKPGMVKVTVYSPGRRSMMVNRPWPSVTTVRACSMSAGLDASTVTPGSTPPVVSVTRPAMPTFCAEAADAASSRPAAVRVTEETNASERRFMPASR